MGAIKNIKLVLLVIKTFCHYCKHEPLCPFMKKVNKDENNE